MKNYGSPQIEWANTSGKCWDVKNFYYFLGKGIGLITLLLFVLQCGCNSVFWLSLECIANKTRIIDYKKQQEIVVFLAFILS